MKQSQALQSTPKVSKLKLPEINEQPQRQQSLRRMPSFRDALDAERRKIFSSVNYVK